MTEPGHPTERPPAILIGLGKPPEAIRAYTQDRLIPTRFNTSGSRRIRSGSRATELNRALPLTEHLSKAHLDAPARDHIQGTFAFVAVVILICVICWHLCWSIFPYPESKSNQHLDF